MPRVTNSRIEWKTETIEQYVNRVGKSVEVAAGEMAIRIGETYQALVKRKTPKDTGALRATIYFDADAIQARVVANKMQTYIPASNGKFKLATVKQKVVEYTGYVGSNMHYASHVEYDTGKYNNKAGNQPYIIRPRAGKKALAFNWPGKGFFVLASVLHPGSRGSYMFQKAQVMLSTDTYIPNKVRDILVAMRAKTTVARPVRP